MVRVICTGNSGFICSWITELLVKEGYEVFGIDNFSGGNPRNLTPGISHVNLSIEDYDNLDYLFSVIKPDYCIHGAAYAAEGLSHFIRRYNYRNNLMGTINIVNLCVNHNVKGLKFLSSMSVYGNSPVPFKEDNTPLPVDPYAISKYAAELDIKCASELFGLNYTIFRPHNVVGQRQNLWDSYRNVVGIFVFQALHDQPLTIFGDGSQVRAFSHVLDVARPIVDSLKMPEFQNQTFNVGGEIPYTILSLAEMVKNIAVTYGKKVTFNFLPARHEVHTAYCDHSKLRSFYNYKSGIELEQTIDEMFEWAIKQPDCEQFSWPKENIEVIDKLPEKWMKALK